VAHCETWRKCVRSFSTATTYMIDYPEYKFPARRRISIRSSSSRIPTYTTASANVSAPASGFLSAEPGSNPTVTFFGRSVVSAVPAGQRYFQREFGFMCREFWNPDVFGYNGQLPQIMQQSGINRFLTQKLSWNRFNKPHHHTFTWQGIDGSEVLAHFPPADTYNAYATVGQLRENARNYKDHDRSQHSLDVVWLRATRRRSPPNML
jgi:alpha-mannosidase